MSPQHIKQVSPQMTPQWGSPAPQRPLTPQPQINQVQYNNVIYTGYPAQKIILQPQLEGSRLKKATKIQPTITFSQQKS